MQPQEYLDEIATLEKELAIFKKAIDTKKKENLLTSLLGKRKWVF